MARHLVHFRRGLPGDDPIFLLNAEAQRRKAAGEDILNATVGALLDDGGRLVVLDVVMELWRELGEMEVAPYAPIAGDPAFLRGITNLHWPQVEGVAAGVATPGGSGALALTVRNFLEPGMALLTARPFWGPYQTIAEEDGLRVETAPWLGYGEGPGLDLDAWEEKARALMSQQDRLLVWLNDPCHNPTGRSLPGPDRRNLLGLLSRLADRGPVTLLLDSAYQDYASDPAAVHEAMSDYAALGAEGKVQVGASLSLSKSLTLYGSRGGALVFPWCKDPEVQPALTMSCRGLFSNCPRAPQSLVVRLLQDGRALERLALEHRHWSEVLRGRAQALETALRTEGMAGEVWDGGFFTTLRLTEHREVFERLRTRGVFVVPLPEGLRVGLCGLRAADAPRFARALREACA
ncbi:MAG: aminotransferase class I/II-fold pyridoxal phosphate-dependent enzyme [Acidobacteria bacterium]|nr:aminotransferase class I/II-fold pyridoxal phosphate-dependent enzyme [Acidobacteriota bacterium]